MLRCMGSYQSGSTRNRSEGNAVNERLDPIDRRLFGDGSRRSTEQPVQGEVLLVTDRRDFERLFEFDGSTGLKFDRTGWDWPVLVHASRQAKVLLIDAAEEDLVAEVTRLTETGAAAVVVFGASDAPLDAMRYLDAGATDYLSMRTSPAERAARLRVAARYVMAALPEPQDQTYVFGDVVVSLDRLTVERAGETVRLTAMEFRLLSALLERAGDIVTHRELLAAMRGIEHLSDRRYLRIYVRQLREKLEENPELPRFIRTEWGMGYRLLAEPADAAVRRISGADSAG
jgi:two-component system KDP operon response regulator KdpE